nr:helix-turn-helix transcriptional regulator [Micromonospora tarapacensis]
MLKRAREAAGLSREEFGKLVGYAPSTIGAFETGERFPQPALVKGADEHLGTGDKFAMLYDMLLLTGDVYKEGFRPWRDAEGEATCIWTYELALIPGLLQTEGYARALLDNDETEVTSRLARQDIFSRDDPPPPTLVALIEERALRTLIGDEEIMREQLDHLVSAAQRHMIQVVPHGTRTYLHLDGPFAIATVDGRDQAFVETPIQGFVVDDAPVVLDMRRRWDVIRAQAMSAHQSIEYIQEAKGQWT